MKNSRIFAVICCAVFLLPFISTIHMRADSPRVTFYLRGGKGIHVLLINLEKYELVDLHWTIQILDHNVEKKNFSGTIDSLVARTSVKITTGAFPLPVGEYDYHFIIDPPGEWDRIDAGGLSWIIGNWILLRSFLAPIPPAN
jgi:hypothetical protein